MKYSETHFPKLRMMIDGIKIEIEPFYDYFIKISDVDQNAVSYKMVLTPGTAAFQYTSPFSFSSKNGTAPEGGPICI